MISFKKITVFSYKKQIIKDIQVNTKPTDRRLKGERRGEKVKRDMREGGQKEGNANWIE